jgi:hypothetical protein
MISMKIFLVTLLSIAILPLTGCALARRGTKQPVLVTTSPSDQSVMIDGIEYTSPMRINLSRGDDHSVTAVSRTGKVRTRQILSQRDILWHITNFYACIPLICNIFDFATGADSDLSPTQVNISLQ